MQLIYFTLLNSVLAFDLEVISLPRNQLRRLSHKCNPYVKNVCCKNWYEPECWYCPAYCNNNDPKLNMDESLDLNYCNTIKQLSANCPGNTASYTCDNRVYDTNPNLPFHWIEWRNSGLIPKTTNWADFLVNSDPLKCGITGCTIAYESGFNFVTPACVVNNEQVLTYRGLTYG